MIHLLIFTKFSHLLSGTSDYDREGPLVTEEEYEEMMDKLKIADSLYTEYTLEEIIYQLAKVSSQLHKRVVKYFR